MKFNHIRFPDKVNFPPLKTNHICHITPASMTLGVLFIINTYFTPHRVFFCHLARESPFTPKWVVNLCANVDPTELPSPTMKELYISSHVTRLCGGESLPHPYLRKWYFWCCNHTTSYEKRNFNHHFPAARNTILVWLHILAGCRIFTLFYARVFLLPVTRLKIFEKIFLSKS